VRTAELVECLSAILQSQLWIAGNVPYDAPQLREDARKKVSALTESIEIIKRFGDRDFDVVAGG